MKKTICKIVSVIMTTLTAVAIIAAITVTGNGLLDLSNIIRTVCIGVAAICGISAVMVGRYGWKSN